MSNMTTQEILQGIRNWALPKIGLATAKTAYCICTTRADVAEKKTNLDGYVLSLGGSIKILMSEANTANNATLNINSTGAKPLYYDGERASTNNSWEAGETVEVYYDGTSYYANNVAGGGGGASTFAELSGDPMENEGLATVLNNKQNVISDLDAIRSGASAGSTAYQKPQNGIPASDIANGVIPDVSNFITASVNNLTNYYLKSETYTKAEVAALIGAIQQFHYEIYASTSDVTAPASNVLYLIGPASISGGDKYEEYVYANNGFVKIGDTSIDLSGKEDSSNKVTSLSQQSTDTQYPSAKAVYDFVKEETGKARETVVITATANTGDVGEDAVITVKVDNTVVGTGTGALTLAVEFGKQYVVECSRVYDYLTPASQTFTASQGSRSVTMAYTYIARDVITIDQTETDETAMVTGDVQGDVIKAIRAASHNYLGTPATQAGDTEGTELICQLDDEDSTKYADGTSAALDGTEGDQWMKLPVFWWKVIPEGTAAADGSYDKYSFSFAFAGEPDPTWKKWEGKKNLLGAKKMYVSDGNGYSRSGIQGSANFTQAQGNSYAAARGTGYSCVTWEWQWMMAILFFAWYGRMNSQAQCGSGSNSNTRTLGTKDSLGMTDTTTSNGNADNTKFWGIENWWGDLSEWIGNVTSNDYVLTIKDMNTGENRNVSGWYQFGGTGGYASRFKVTVNLDFIPVAKSATETTSYCDWVNGNSGSRVVSRSLFNASAGGGVAYVGTGVAPSSASANIGSRLAFNGVIAEAESVAAYKAALPVGQ